MDALAFIERALVREVIIIESDPGLLKINNILSIFNISISDK